MIYAAIGSTALLFAIYGDECWFAGVLKVDRAKGDPSLWYAWLYSGGPDERTINPRKIDTVYIDPNAKDPFTGQLLLEEMQELVKSKEIVYIRRHRKEGGVEDMVTTIEPSIRLKLNVQLPP